MPVKVGGSPGVVADVPGEPQVLREAARTLGNAASTLDEQGGRLGRTTGEGPGGWSGTASMACRGLCSELGAQVSRGAEGLRQAAEALTVLAGRLEAAKERAGDAAARAERAESDREAEAGSRRPNEAELQHLDQVVGRAHAEAAAALEEARRAATAAAGRFAEIERMAPRVEAPAGPAMPSLLGVGGIGGLSALGVFARLIGAMLYGQAGAPTTLPGNRLAVGGESIDLDDASPAAIAAFFARIGPSEGIRVANAHPEIVGRLDGAPVELRYAANRELAEREVERLEGELAAVETELADEEGDDGFWPAHWPVVPPPLGPASRLVPPVVDHFVKDRGELLAERRSDLQARLETLRPFTDPERQLLVFDPRGDGRVAEVFGDLDHARHTAVFVPGIGNDISTFGGENRREVLAVHERANFESGGQTATVAWLDYDSPDGFHDPATYGNDNAAAGAESLARLVEGMNARNPDAHTAVFGHSYGSVVVGQSAAHHGLAADDVVLTGSPGPGAGVDHGSDLQGDDPDRRIWVGETSGDVIAEQPIPELPDAIERGVPDGSDLEDIHGPDPAEPDFGARRFDTGPPLEPLKPPVEVDRVDVAVPSLDIEVEVTDGPVRIPGIRLEPGIERVSVPYDVDVNPEALGEDLRILKARHTTDYFDTRAESFRNIVRLVNGQTDSVTAP